MQLAVGQIFKGIYRVREVRSGGMGIVYICEPAGTGFPLEPRSAEDVEPKPEPAADVGMIAIKTVTTDFYSTGDNQQQFEREALIWTTLPPHPYIVETLFVDRIGQAPLIALRYAAGGNLRDRIAAGPLTVDEALRVVRQTCVALDLLESLGVFHRDLKPENLLFGDTGDVLVTDFGLASLQNYGLLSAHEDEPGAFMGGTLPYMSPEHFGAGEFCAASDVYSLGAVLYETLEGRLLFDCRTVEDYRTAHLRGRPPRLARGTAPAAIRKIVEKCLEKRPSRRFSGFAELDDALAEAIRRERLTVEPPQHPSLVELEAQITASGWNRRGYGYAMLRRLDESLDAYERSLELDPEGLGAHANVAAALERLGRDDEALAHRERDIELHPRVALTRAILGDVYLARGRLEDAAEQLELATRWDPLNMRSIRLLVRVYRQLGRDDEVPPLVAQISEQLASEAQGHGAAGWVNEGLHFGLMNEFEAAMHFFDEAVERFPGVVDCWHNRAVTLLLAGRVEEASDSNQRAMALNPDAPQTLFLMGWLWILRGQPQLAAAAWTELQTRHPAHRYASIASGFAGIALGVPGDVAWDMFSSLTDVANSLYYRA